MLPSNIIELNTTESCFRNYSMLTPTLLYSDGIP